MSKERTPAEKQCGSAIIFLQAARNEMMLADHEAECLVDQLTELQTSDPDFGEVDQMLEEINFLRRRIASFTITAIGMKTILEQREFHLHEQRVQASILDDDIPF